MTEKTDATAYALQEHVSDSIWLCSYGVQYFGCALEARMTIIRLSDGRLLLHSPCKIEPSLKREILTLGEVAYIVVPSNFHTLHASSAQVAFPEALTYICSGVEKKLPDLAYDGMLGSDARPEWADEFEQQLVLGSRWMPEVAFYHKASKTLILVDLVENITDATPRTNWVLKLWWKLVFRMWNKPLPAPEYRMGWRDKTAARASLSNILEWDFQRVVLAHGDLIETNAQQVVRQAWASVLQP